MATTAEETAHRPAQSTKLTQARAGLAYLVNPATHPAPGSLVTRSSLKTFRYVLKFVFWRLVRYAKYAAVGAATAALAGTVLGTALPWLSALIVPSMPVAAAMGATTALIKFTWRHTGNRFMRGWHSAGEGRDARADEAGDAKEASEELSRSARRAARAERSWQTEATAFA